MTESDEQSSANEERMDQDILAAEGLSIIEETLSAADESNDSLLDRGELPRSFDGLEVEALIGVGGMSEVYRARQVGLDRIVAVKVRVARSCDGPFADELLANEARTLAELDQAPIARVHSIGEVAGRRYLVMDHIEGSALTARMEGETPIAEALELTLGIAKILAEAHAKGLAHRDLKPANILITEDSSVPLAERVRVIDFGLAGRLFGVDGIAGMGTRDFAAPEQRAGELVGPPADIYALRRIFERMVDDDWLQLPNAVRRMLRRMRAVNPSDRPTAERIVQILSERPARPARARQWMLAVGAAGAMLASAVLVGRSPSPASNATVAELDIADPVSMDRANDAEAFEETKERFFRILEELDTARTEFPPLSEDDLSFFLRRLPRVPERLRGLALERLDVHGIEVTQSTRRFRALPR